MARGRIYPKTLIHLHKNTVHTQAGAVCWLAGWLAGRLAGWLAGWLARWLAGWIGRWLVWLYGGGILAGWFGCTVKGYLLSERTFGFDEGLLPAK